MNERRYRARRDHGEARRRVLETSRRQRARRSDDKKAAKAEKKALFTMGIAMNDDKVYLVVTQKDAAASA